MEEVPDTLSALERLIGQAGERRVEQMLHIAVLLADGADADTAEDELRRIETLLVEMRRQRNRLAVQPVAS